MTFSGLSAVAGVLTIFVAACFQEVSAIKCWRCSSDEFKGEFCNDPFDLSIATEHQRRWAYVECAYPPGQKNPFDQPLVERAVCKKVKQVINVNEYHVFRLCAFENIHAPRNECVNVHTPSYIKTEFCETCDTDGCNAAPIYGPIALLIIISVALAKLLFIF